MKHNHDKQLAECRKAAKNEPYAEFKLIWFSFFFFHSIKYKVAGGQSPTDKVANSKINYDYLLFSGIANRKISSWLSI